MKTRSKIMIAVSIAAGIGGLALVQPTFAQGDKRFFGSSGHHGMAGRGMRLFERFDSDKDGILTQAEIDKSRSDLMARFDADRDGKLSLREYEGLWLEFARERMVDRFQHLDRDGDAAVTSEEFAQPTKNIVIRIDGDDDGRITAKEMVRMRRHGKHHGGRTMRQKHHKHDSR